MSSYPKYDPSVAISQPAPDFSAANAHLQAAHQDQSLADMMTSLTNKFTDAYATDKGKRDAEKQGDNWKPATNLTEAGRAYNNAGATIARNTTATEMALSYNNFFNQVANKPIDVTNSKTSSTAQLDTLMTQYTDQMKVGKSEEVQQWMNQNLLHAQAMLIPKMSEKVALQQKAIASQASLQNATNAAAVYINSAYNVANSPVGNLKGTAAQKAQAESYALLGKNHTNAAMQFDVATKNLLANGYMRASAVNRLRATTEGQVAFAKQSGRLQYYMHNLQIHGQTLSPDEYEKYSQNITSFPKNYQNSTQDNNILEKQANVAKLQGMVNSWVAQQRSNNAALMDQAKSIKEMAYNGQTNKVNSLIEKTEVFATPLQKMKMETDYQAGIAAKSMMQSANTTQQLAALRQEILTNPNFGQNAKGTINPQVLDKAKNYALTKINDLSALARTDPGGFILRSKSTLDEVQGVQDNIKGNSPAEISANQTEFNRAVNDPNMLLLQTMSPEVKSGLNKTWNMFASKQNMNNLHTQLSTSTALKSMAQTINSAGTSQGKLMLDQLAANTGSHYSSFLTSLINHGLSGKVWAYSNTPDKDYIAHSDALDDPDFMKKALTSTGVEGGLKAAQRIFVQNDKTAVALQNLSQSLTNAFTTPYIKTTLMNGMETAISKEILYKSQESGIKYADGVKQFGNQIATDLIDSKYQDPLLRMPNTISIDPNKPAVALNRENANLLMSDIRQKAIDNWNQEYYTKDVKTVAEKNTYKGLQQIAIENGHFIPSANGDGVVYVDSAGHPVISKSGSFIGMKWSDTLNVTTMKAAQKDVPKNPTELAEDLRRHGHPFLAQMTLMEQGPML